MRDTFPPMKIAKLAILQKVAWWKLLMWAMIFFLCSSDAAHWPRAEQSAQRGAHHRPTLSVMANTELLIRAQISTYARHYLHPTERKPVASLVNNGIQAAVMVMLSLARTLFMAV